MNRKCAGFFSGFVVLMHATASYAADEIGWKAFAASEKDSVKYVGFYRSDDIRRTSDGHVLVWTEALPLTSLRQAAVKIGGPERAKTYVPPIVSVKKLEAWQIKDIISMERAADSGFVQRPVRLFVDMDCSGRRDRIVEAVKPGTPIKLPPQAFKSIPRESGRETLFKLMCERRSHLEYLE